MTLFKRRRHDAGLAWSERTCRTPGGVELAVSVTEGRGDATLLMLPGFTSKRKNSTNVEVAGSLARLGVRCAAADLSGHGDSAGRIEDQTVSRAATEVQTIVEFLRESESGLFGLLGNSFSATAAIIACSNGAPVDALGLKSPILDYVQMRSEQLGDERMALWRDSGTIKLDDGTPSHYDFIVDAEGLDVGEALAGLSIPVCAVHGGKDEQIPAAQVARWDAEFAQGRYEHAILRDGNHSLDGKYFGPMVHILKSFFTDRLLGLPTTLG